MFAVQILPNLWLFLTYLLSSGVDTGNGQWAMRIIDV
jgi:hypothetical protein